MMHYDELKLELHKEFMFHHNIIYSYKMWLRTKTTISFSPFFNCYKRCIPAPGVMHTSPVIMPWTAPITEGFPKKATSREVHTRRLVAAHMFVFNTAMEDAVFAAYGAPPLKPDHPIHSNPAPASISSTLFGGNLSLSLFSLGPTCTYIHMCCGRSQKPSCFTNNTWKWGITLIISKVFLFFLFSRYHKLVVTHLVGCWLYSMNLEVFV